MSEIENMLKDNAHRPYPIPEGPWIFYQEWEDILFLHWKIPPEEAIKLIPTGLGLDLYEGEAWVSFIGFTVDNLRPRFVPPLPGISDFHELNFRTYVVKDGKPGVYFVSIEAQKWVDVYLSKIVTGLPYHKADIKRRQGRFKSRNPTTGFHFDAKFETSHHKVEPNSLDRWLLERYCLYVDVDKELFSFDIHHRAWTLKGVHIESLDLHYKYRSGLTMGDRDPDLVHFSVGSKGVVIWPRAKVK